MVFQRLLLFIALAAAGVVAPLAARANHVFIPMDNTQKECLKAYGVAFWLLQREVPVDWLLNYRGGSFA
ncbi:MAG TPA: asparagine synthetase B, partial [Hymenobacter sp.]